MSDYSLALTQEYYPEDSANQLLEDVRAEFIRAFPDSKTNVPVGEHKFVIDLCDKYNGAARGDKLIEVQQKLGETKDAMKTNVVNMVSANEQAIVRFFCITK